MKQRHRRSLSPPGGDERDQSDGKDDPSDRRESIRLTRDGQRKSNDMDAPRLGVDEQHTVDVEGDAVLEELASRRGGAEQRRSSTGFHLGDEPETVARHDVVGAKGDLDVDPVDRKEVRLCALRAYHGVALGFEELATSRFTFSRCRESGEQFAPAQPCSNELTDKENDEQPHGDDEAEA